MKPPIAILCSILQLSFIIYASAGLARPSSSLNIHNLAVGYANAMILQLPSGKTVLVDVGFDPEAQEFFSITEIESGGGAVRHMMYFAPTNTIWFATDTNTLGRAELPD